MFAMRESTNNDMHKMEKGMDINATDSFDVVGSLGSGGEQLSMDEVLDLLTTDDANDNRDANPSRHLDNGRQDDTMVVGDANREPAMEFTNEDFGSMPFYPVDTQRGDDFLGLSSTYQTKAVVPGKDYSAEWKQHRGLGKFDYYAEIAPEPNGRKTISVADLSQIPKHCVVQTQLGLAVLLNPEDAKNADISNLQQPVALKQPTPNALGVQNANSTPSVRKFQRWSPEEDEILRQAVATEGGPPYNWKRISAKYFGNSRTGLQCKSRWTKSLKPGIVRGPFTPEEEDCILKCRLDGLKWSQIAEYLPGRLAEQIADRFNNYLDPALKKGPWTPEEDQMLFREQRRLGNKWTQISHLIPGRSENSVKNRWHNLKVTRQRKMRQNAMELQRQDIKPVLSQAETQRAVSPPPFVVRPPGSNDDSPRQIVDAPRSHTPPHTQFILAPPKNTHTIFRPTTPSPPNIYQV